MAEDAIVTNGIPIDGAPTGALCPRCQTAATRLGPTLALTRTPTLTSTLTLTWPGPVPLRREIRSLQADFPDQWTLYLLGLKAFQEVDENDLLSYYQIAGEPSCGAGRERNGTELIRRLTSAA